MTQRFEFKEEWGTHDLMAVAAFRYCLGRRTYIVSDCVRWIIRWWETFHPQTKALMVKEVHEAIKLDRAGDACDLSEWVKITKLDPYKGLSGGQGIEVE